MNMQEIPNVELLKEFRRRFSGSCLSALEFQKALDEIGLKEIKHYLDNMELKVIKKPRRD